MAEITYLPRMRTLDECYRELKELDPNTAVSKYFVRRLALSGAIPTVKCGCKRLINLDGLIAYLNEPHRQRLPSTEPLPDTSQTVNGIRKIGGDRY